MQKTHPYQTVFGPLEPAEGTKDREEVQIKTAFLRELGMGLEVVIFGS